MRRDQPGCNRGDCERNYRIGWREHLGGVQPVQRFHPLIVLHASIRRSHNLQDAMSGCRSWSEESHGRHLERADHSDRTAPCCRDRARSHLLAPRLHHQALDVQPGQGMPRPRPDPIPPGSRVGFAGLTVIGRARRDGGTRRARASGPCRAEAMLGPPPSCQTAPSPGQGLPLPPVG